MIAQCPGVVQLCLKPSLSRMSKLWGWGMSEKVLQQTIIELGRQYEDEVAALRAELARVEGERDHIEEQFNAWREGMEAAAEKTCQERDAARAAAGESTYQYARLLGEIRSYADDFTICPFCSVHGDNAHLRTCLVSEAEAVLKGLKR